MFTFVNEPNKQKSKLILWSKTKENIWEDFMQTLQENHEIKSNFREKIISYYSD